MMLFVSKLEYCTILACHGMRATNSRMMNLIYIHVHLQAASPIHDGIILFLNYVMHYILEPV